VKETSVTNEMTGIREADSASETSTEVISEALSVIDKALAEMLRRELVSSGEVADLLLDVRSLLTAKPVVAATSAAD
jgi:hypothetical protein